MAVSDREKKGPTEESIGQGNLHHKRAFPNSFEKLKDGDKRSQVRSRKSEVGERSDDKRCFRSRLWCADIYLRDHRFDKTDPKL